MFSFSRHSRRWWCLVLVWTAQTVFGQSLAVVRKGGGQLAVEASAPSPQPWVLQASRNLRLWVDVQEIAAGTGTYPFETGWFSSRCFRLAPATEPAEPIKLVLIGDSTVADLASNNYDWCGWGQGMYGYFKANARVVNLAWPGLTTKWFLASEQRQQMLVIRPQYVLVQFGAVDDTIAPDDPMAVSLPEFQDNLKTIVKTIRGFGGTPILITPPVWRQFDSQTGQVFLYASFEQRCAIVREVAAELLTPLIDLNQLTLDLYNRLGNLGSYYIQAPKDPVHYSEVGALVVAQLVVNALPADLGPYLTGIFDRPFQP